MRKRINEPAATSTPAGYLKRETKENRVRTTTLYVEHNLSKVEVIENDFEKGLQKAIANFKRNKNEKVFNNLWR